MNRLLTAALVLCASVAWSGQRLPQRPFGYSTLNDSLVAFWNLEETSGNRADAVGTGCGGSGCTLTDNNTVTSNPGAPSTGVAGQFTAANSENLSRADDASLDFGDEDFTVACWAYTDSQSALTSILSKWDVASNNREYFLNYLNTTDRYRFQVSTTGASIDVLTVVADNFGGVPASTWSAVFGYHDAAGDVVGIAVNDGTPNTSAIVLGVFSGAATFRIGAQSATAANFWDGRIDACGVWSKVLSVAERAEFYNLGNGKQFRFAGLPEPMTLASWLREEWGWYGRSR